MIAWGSEARVSRAGMAEPAAPVRRSGSLQTAAPAQDVRGRRALRLRAV